MVAVGGFSDATVAWLFPLCASGMWFVQPWCLEWGLRRNLRRHLRRHRSNHRRTSATGASARTSSTTSDVLVFGGLALVLVATTGGLARAWHPSVVNAFGGIDAPEDIPTFGIVLLWYPIGIQVLRYLHCASVGASGFVDRFGLVVVAAGGGSSGKGHDDASQSQPVLSRERLRIFMWSTPTVIFHSQQQQHQQQQQHRCSSSPSSSPSSSKGGSARFERTKKQRYGSSNHQTNESWATVAVRSVRELGAMVAVCGTVLGLESFGWASRDYPWLVSRVLRVLVLGLSVSLFRILFEVGPRWWLLPVGDAATTTTITVLPVYDSPLLAASPRDFWRRWSVSAGFHLKEAFYLPWIATTTGHDHKHKHSAGTTTGGRTPSGRRSPKGYKLVAAVAPFSVNAVLHATWWSLGITGTFDAASYQILLLLWPLGSLALQDALEWALSSAPSRAPMGTPSVNAARLCLNRALVWAGFCLVVDRMQASQGAPPGLRGLCRGNLLLPA